MWSEVAEGSQEWYGGGCSGEKGMILFKRSLASRVFQFRSYLR